MFFRYKRLYFTLIFFLFIPVFVGLSLKMGQPKDFSVESPHLKHGLSEYNRIFAKVFSRYGKLDYDLFAKRLIFQSDLKYQVFDPLVTISQVRQESMRSKTHDLFNDIALTIESKQAVFSDDFLSFSGSVKLNSKPSQYKTNSKSSPFPTLVRSNHLKYDVTKHYFVAEGSVEYCRGVQEVFANKVSGHVDKEDFNFDHGKIVYRRYSRCL